MGVWVLHLRTCWLSDLSWYGSLDAAFETCWVFVCELERIVFLSVLLIIIIIINSLVWPTFVCTKVFAHFTTLTDSLAFLCHFCLKEKCCHVVLSTSKPQNHCTHKAATAAGATDAIAHQICPSFCLEVSSLLYWGIGWVKREESCTLPRWSDPFQWGGMWRQIFWSVCISILLSLDLKEDLQISLDFRV